MRQHTGGFLLATVVTNEYLICPPLAIIMFLNISHVHLGIHFSLYTFIWLWATAAHVQSSNWDLACKIASIFPPSSFRCSGKKHHHDHPYDFTLARLQRAFCCRLRNNGVWRSFKVSKWVINYLVKDRGLAPFICFLFFLLLFLLLLSLLLLQQGRNRGC